MSSTRVRLERRSPFSRVQDVLRGPDQSRLVGEDHRLDPAASTDLGEDVADVGLHGGGGDGEPVGDLGVGVAGGDGGEDVPLTSGEGAQSVARCGAADGALVADGVDERTGQSGETTTSPAATTRTAATSSSAVASSGRCPAAPARRAP